MDITLTDIILEGELLKDKALNYDDDDLSEELIIDNIHVEVEEWIKKIKKVLSSNCIDHNIDLDDPSWDSLGSHSREALNGFIEKRLKELRPLITNQIE